MGEAGLGSEGGGGRAEHIGWDESRGSNDGKTSAEYARGLRQSGSVGEAEVMLVRCRMRNRFSERLVMRLTERGYHEKKAGGRGYWGGRLEGEMSRPRDLRRRAAWERIHSERRDEEAGRCG